MTEEAEGCVAVAEAAGIICSLRAADLAGWTPPWKTSGQPSSEAMAKKEETGWPSVARGKRTRSSRSGSAANKGRRWARGSPASPLDYSGGSGSGSGASTSGGEDGAFCSTPATAAIAATPASSSLGKVGSAGGARRPLIMPAPPPRAAGQRSRKKMRLPEVKQMVLSLSAENAVLRQEMESLQMACKALSKENGTLETRLEHSSSSSKRKRTESEEEERRQRKPQQAGGGFALPDLNIPAQDVADAPAAP
ncbi:zinc finger CCCH domain-containing protein 18-like [Hordeum vulgare subsp. vulgare]|uniref:BZIP domain-containing protein n=1 Tax=Hordeum vulgare subsp. vulgare TaxID=112509 RepID=A0A8I6Z0R5_HORVV|nr:zinc finger CCCH domain-containing protein 18-like [Hordeum vulgare subsp. vulgare]